MPSGKYPAGDHHIDTKKLNEELLATLSRLVLPNGRDAGGFTIHSLRHFFETFCVNARVPQRVVDIWMGHKPERSMGAAYYELSDQQSQKFMGEVPFGGVEPVGDTQATATASKKGDEL